MLTRRTCHRTFRLRPHPLTNQIALYCLAAAASKYGMLIHAVVFMSNHLHLVVTDPNGCLPDFQRDLHRSLAKAMNASQGQWGNLWSAEHPSQVLLPTLEDVVAKVAYAVANPVAAALVRSPSQWPGVLLWKPGTVVVKRPDAYFRAQGSAPESATLNICPLPGVDIGAWLELATRAIQESVEDARKAVLEQGLRFLGAAAVMAESFLSRAKSYELKRKHNPELAARDESVRETCKRVLRDFRRSYADALESWRAGDRTAVFPFGTWWMRIHHAARVAPAPT